MATILSETLSLQDCSTLLYNIESTPFSLSFSGDDYSVILHNASYVLIVDSPQDKMCHLSLKPSTKHNATLCAKRFDVINVMNRIFLLLCFERGREAFDSEHSFMYWVKRKEQQLLFLFAALIDVYWLLIKLTNTAMVLLKQRVSE